MSINKLVVTTLIRFLGISALTLLTACASVNNESDGPLQWETVHLGSHGPGQPSQIIAVRDQDSWNRLLEQQFGRSLPQEILGRVDFRNRMIAAVFLGQRSDSCYSVRIESAYRKDGRIKVEYSEQLPFWGQRPPGRAICFYSHSFPYHIISLPRLPDPVDFVRLADTPSF